MTCFSSPLSFSAQHARTRDMEETSYLKYSKKDEAFAVNPTSASALAFCLGRAEDSSPKRAALSSDSSSMCYKFK